MGVCERVHGSCAGQDACFVGWVCARWEGGETSAEEGRTAVGEDEEEAAAGGHAHLVQLHVGGGPRADAVRAPVRRKERYGRWTMGQGGDLIGLRPHVFRVHTHLLSSFSEPASSLSTRRFATTANSALPPSPNAHRPSRTSCFLLLLLLPPVACWPAPPDATDSSSLPPLLLRPAVPPPPPPSNGSTRSACCTTVSSDSRCKRRRALPPWKYAHRSSSCGESCAALMAPVLCACWCVLYEC